MLLVFYQLPAIGATSLLTVDEKWMPFDGDLSGKLSNNAVEGDI